MQKLLIFSLILVFCLGVINAQHEKEQGEQEQNVQDISTEMMLKQLKQEIENLKKKQETDLKRETDRLFAYCDELRRTNQALKASLEQNTPVGTIQSYFGEKIPAGWLLVNGSTINKEQYPNLVAYLTSLGMGNGSTATLPDLRSVFLRGLDMGRGVDPARKLGSEQQDTNKAHNHNGNTLASGNHSHSGGTNVVGDHAHSGDTNVVGDHAHSGDTNVVGDHAHSGNTNGEGAHTHGMEVAGNHNHKIDEAGQHSHLIQTGGIWHRSFQGEKGKEKTAYQHVEPTSTAGNHIHNIYPEGNHIHNIQGVVPHVHSFGTNTVGNHHHSFSTNTVGNHHHSFSTNTVGNHHHSFSTNDAGNHAHIFSTENSGDNETRPKNVAVMFIIKY